ncbi:hypothetical protein HDU92_001933 [Lobulomyces angularis]|nr:hypothetical protein HDU92_001933 [Lobulomyces angularis]
MFFPTVAAVSVSLTLTFLKVRKSIPSTVEATIVDFSLKDRSGALIGCLTLLLCLLSLSIVPIFWKVDVWMLTLPFAVILFILDVFKDVMKHRSTKKGNSAIELRPTGNEIDSLNLTGASRSEEINTLYIEDVKDEAQNNSNTVYLCGLQNTCIILSRIPWLLIPFCFGMFIMVESLNSTGWTSVAAAGLNFATGNNVIQTTLVTGLITAISCNLMNNLPMTIFFVKVLQNANFNEEKRVWGMFALIFGSNFGANILFLGSLAGLMWSKLVASKGFKQSQFEFFMTCMPVTTAAIISSCLVLSAEFLIFKDAYTK